MHITQHIQHEASRYATELRHVRSGRIKPAGSIAYASIYSQGVPQGQHDAQRYKPFLLEVLHKSGLWVHCKSLRPSTLEAAQNIARTLPGYRVVVHKGNGRYE